MEYYHSKFNFKLKRFDFEEDYIIRNNLGLIESCECTYTNLSINNLFIRSL
jgi:hypothetical protein